MSARSDFSALRQQSKEGRYRVGCAGMFVLGTDYLLSDELDALMAACEGPAGCEVLDTHTGKWIGPYCLEDDQDIRARYAARKESR